jgi:Tfp pilus assembly protein PilN
LPEVFGLLLSCSAAHQEQQHGSPVLLYPQRAPVGGHSGSFLQTVQQQLHELQSTAEQQAVLVQRGQVQQGLQQQRQPRQGAAGQPLAGFDLSWSEVTHGAIKHRF